ncbi:MAG: metallophosphoesterase [Clostridium sp.]
MKKYILIIAAVLNILLIGCGSINSDEKIVDGMKFTITGLTKEAPVGNINEDMSCNKNGEYFQTGNTSKKVSDYEYIVMDLKVENTTDKAVKFFRRGWNATGPDGYEFTNISVTDKLRDEEVSAKHSFRAQVKVPVEKALNIIKINIKYNLKDYSDLVLSMKDMEAGMSIEEVKAKYPQLYIDNFIEFNNLKTMKVKATESSGFKSIINTICGGSIFPLSDNRTSQKKLKENFLESIDINKKNLIFGMISDVHYTSEGGVGRNEITSYANWRDVMGEIKGLDFGFLGGDIVNGHNGKKATIADIKDVTEVLAQSNVDICYTKGNHDLANHSNPQVISDLIDDEETYNLITKYLMPANSVGEKDTNYYYVDYPKQKIRCIFLDTIDIGYKTLIRDYEYGIRQKQLEFLIKSLEMEEKNDRSQWAVATFAHMPFNKNASCTEDTQIGNGLVAEAIINAFKNGSSYSKVERNIGDFNIDISCDFSKYGKSEHIAHFHGHSHIDRTLDLNGIKYVSVVNAESRRGETTLGTYVRIEDSPTENAFDIIQIDRNHRKIKCERFGAGENRLISY